MWFIRLSCHNHHVIDAPVSLGRLHRQILGTSNAIGRARR